MCGNSLFISVNRHQFHHNEALSETALQFTHFPAWSSQLHGCQRLQELFRPTCQCPTSLTGCDGAGPAQPHCTSDWRGSPHFTLPGGVGKMGPWVTVALSMAQGCLRGLLWLNGNLNLSHFCSGLQPWCKCMPALWGRGGRTWDFGQLKDKKLLSDLALTWLDASTRGFAVCLYWLVHLVGPQQDSGKLYKYTPEGSVSKEGGWSQSCHSRAHCQEARNWRGDGSRIPVESRGGCQATRCKHPSHSEVGEDPWCQGLVLMCPWVTVVAIRGEHLHFHTWCSQWGI